MLVMDMSDDFIKVPPIIYVLCFALRDFAGAMARDDGKSILGVQL